MNIDIKQINIDTFSVNGIEVSINDLGKKIARGYLTQNETKAFLKFFQGKTQKEKTEMNTLQLIAELQRYYDQLKALKSVKNKEYTNEKYTLLKDFYESKIREFRERIENQDAEALFQFDTNRAYESSINSGIEHL